MIDSKKTASGINETPLIANHSAMIVKLDNHGKITRVNNSFCEFTGFTEDELTGRDDFFFNVKLNSIEQISNLKQQLISEQIVEETLRVEQKDSGTSFIKVRFVPIVNLNNEIDEIIVHGDGTSQSPHSERLEDSEKLYEATFKQMAVGISHVGLNGEWLHVNQKLCDILGYRKDELIKLTFQDVTHPDDLDDDLEFVEKMLRGEIETYSFEKRYIRKDDTIIWINLTVSLIRETDLTPKFFISVIQDISKQKETQTQLDESNAIFKQLAEGLPLLVWTCHADGKCDYLSPQWIEFTGVPLEEQLEHGWLRQVHPDDQKSTIAAWEKTYKDDSKLDVEFRIRRYDGTYRWFATKAVPFRNAEGTTIKWFGTNTDIEKSKRVEQILTESQDNLRRILDNLFAFVFVLDSEGTVTEVNQTATVATGTNADEEVGKKFWDCSWWYKDDFSRKQLQKATKTVAEGSHLRFDTELKVVDDKVLIVDFMYSPMKDRNGKVIKLIATAVDITHRNEIQKKLEEYAVELKHSNEELEQFANIASHDLQEPLRMVASYTEMLSKRYSGQLDERADKYIMYAVQGATRMQELINDLLTFSRIGSTTNHFHQVDSNKIMEIVLGNLKSQMKDVDAEIIYEDLPELHSDATILGQLFQNLIANSLKFHSEEKPVVEISVEKHKRHWLFAFKDNGIGIEEKYLKNIFQMFRRLHERNKYKGSGIGLAVVKKIVELHKGKIWAESDNKTGTTFYFTIPIKKKEGLLDVQTD